VTGVAYVPRIIESAPSVNILVVGDVMLDAYVSGDATRISPEAPVPVVAVLHRRYLPGGAANVAANIRALGSRVTLAGVIGSDDPGLKLGRELELAGICRALVEDRERITTVKTRITAGGQQIVRFDEENTSPLSGAVADELKNRCKDAIRSADACVISDYAKGVAGQAFCQWLIGEAIRNKKPVVVDPKSRDFGRYRGATVITPNLKETAAAAGDPVHSSEELSTAVSHLLAGIAPSALLVTRGGEGMSLFEQGKEVWQLPALAVEVSDVTGAGDTVAGVLAIVLALGFSLRGAAGVANLAAGLAVRHPGTWAVQPHELLEAAEHFGPGYLVPD
jgi:rfaE bifunctional protein kinase chain/domain